MITRIQEYFDIAPETPLILTSRIGRRHRTRDRRANRTPRRARREIGDPHGLDGDDAIEVVPPGELAALPEDVDEGGAVVVAIDGFLDDRVEIEVGGGNRP